MSTHTRFTTREEVQREATRRIRDLLEENGNSPTRVSKALPGEPNKGLIHRVADGGYSEMVTVSLGLPVVKNVSMPICLECGEVHEVKLTCDDKLKAPYRRRLAADLANDDWGAVQKAALERQYTRQGYKTWSQKVAALAETAINELSAEEFEEITMSLIPDGRDNL